MSIGENIKLLRSHYDLNQTELANIAGVTSKAVSTWENDIKTPRMGPIQKMADYFGLLKSDIIEEGGIAKALVSNSTQPINKDEINALGRSQLQLTEHEEKVILAYKAQPEMQPPIDKLLGVEKETKSEPISNPSGEGEEMVRVFRAARSDNHTEGGWVEIPKWQMDILKNAEPDEGDF